MIDFKLGEDLGDWLKGQPQEVAFVVAARCALRVQPFLARAITGDFPEQNQKTLFLDSFRAVHRSCVAAVYPNRNALAVQNSSTTRAYAAYVDASAYKPGAYGNAFSFAELNAAKSANAVKAADAANTVYAYDVLTATSAHNASAADNIKFFDGQSSSGGTVNEGKDRGFVGAVTDAIEAEAANAIYVAAKSVDPSYIDAGEAASDSARHAGYKASDAVWAAVSSDCTKSKIMDPTSLLGTSIWPYGWPDWFKTEISTYFALLDAPEWGIWKRWYQGMLDGDPLDWAVQRETAEIPNVNWEAGPERIADILNGGPVEKESFLRP